MPQSSASRRLTELLDAAGAGRPRQLLGRATEGTSHLTLKVKAADGLLAVRLPMPVSRLATGVAEEQRVLQAVSDAGLAPRLLHFDPADGAHVSEWHPGRVWTAADLEREPCLLALAGQLRRLHALRVDVAAFDLSAAVDGYRCALEQAGMTSDATVRHRLDELQRLGNEFVRTRATCALAHNDLVAANLVGDGVPRLLDWEFAARNDPLFDLATLTGLHALSASSCATLLEALEVDAVQRDRLEALERTVRLLAWAWAHAERLRRRHDARPVQWLRLVEPWLR